MLVGLDVCHQTHLRSRQLAAGDFQTDLGRFVQVETASEALAGTSVAWLPGRASAWSRPDSGDNALVATGIDVAGLKGCSPSAY